MPKITTKELFCGYYPEKKTEFTIETKKKAEFIIETNNDSWGEKPYELIISEDTGAKLTTILTLDLDEYDIQEIIQMLQIILNEKRLEK